MTNDPAEPSSPPRQRSILDHLRRWGPLIALVLLMVLVFAMGWHNYISFETIGTNYQVLKDFIDANFAVAILIYMLVYVAMVALSLPGGLVLTVTGGLLFGWLAGAIGTVIGATIGATIIFLIAKSSLGEALADKAGAWLGKLREGFKENALSYLLFLRLVPAFPFWLVNLAPALLGVPLRTYVLGTAIGIMMGSSWRLDRVLDGLLVLGLNIPALVTIILCYIWLGLTEAAAVTAVALNKIPTVTVNTRPPGRESATIAT